MSVANALHLQVEVRAGNRCEYCRAPQEIAGYRFHIDHIVAVKCGGVDLLENLALACAACNQAKGPKISAIDPLTGAKVRLFDPRRDPWEDHFWWRDEREIEATTPMGRATI